MGKVLLGIRHKVRGMNGFFLLQGLVFAGIS